jgi:hypothetical protein
MLRSKNKALLSVGVVACALSAHRSAFAQVMEVDPFAGEWIEGFETILPGGYSDLPVLQPNSDAEGLLGTMTFAFVTSGSIFAGSTVVGHNSLLFAHSTSPFEISFSTPIQQFGAYLATNSGASGGTVRFFDANDQLIATMPLDVTFAQGIAPYTWNGWSSAVPFTRMTISSNGLLQGFLGIDDMQAIVVPAPAASLIGLLMLTVGFGARRCGRQR